jgi:hypothetical protein
MTMEIGNPLSVPDESGTPVVQERRGVPDESGTEHRHRI